MKCKECGHEIKEEHWEFLSIDGKWTISKNKFYGTWHGGKPYKLASEDKDYNYYIEELVKDKYLWRKKK